jgi:nucleoside-diphosphate-sugar epimerase
MPSSTNNDVQSRYGGQRVLVIGGSGFIGHNLVVRLVAGGAHVTSMSRGLAPQIAPLGPEVLSRTADLTDTRAMLDLIPEHDIIFSVAGPSGAASSSASMREDMHVNLIGQHNLLEACRRAETPPRVIFGSTRLVYGKPQYLPVDEGHPTQPTSLYGIHHLAAQGYHQHYHRVHGVPTTILRITVPYGPHQIWNTYTHGVVNLFIRRAVQGQPIQIYGSGQQLRDLLYIDDLVDAILAIAMTPDTVGQIINVGSGQPTELRVLAKMITELAGGGELRSVPWPKDAADVETGDFYADISRLQALTGFAPRIPLADGLRESIAFYRSVTACPGT